MEIILVNNVCTFFISVKFALEELELEKKIVMDYTDNEARVNPIEKGNVYSFYKKTDQLIESAISAVENTEFMSAFFSFFNIKQKIITKNCGLFLHIGEKSIDR